jgi:hypothetical protein
MRPERACATSRSRWISLTACEASEVISGSPLNHVRPSRRITRNTKSCPLTLAWWQGKHVWIPRSASSDGLPSMNWTKAQPTVEGFRPASGHRSLFRRLSSGDHEFDDDASIQGLMVCVSRRGNICSSEPPGQRPVCLGAILGELDSRHSTELPSLHDHVCSARQIGNHLDVLSISADDPLRKSPGHENSRNGNMEYRTLGSGTPRDCARSLPAPASTSSAPPE